MTNAKKKLSVIIPAYNEALTIGKVIEDAVEETRNLNLEEEIIVIDDASADETENVVSRLGDKANIIYKKKAFNEGKGSAITEGFKSMTGDIAIIQDADLEYSSKDYERLISPILNDKADVVFGNRFQGEVHSVIYFRNYIGNRLLTFISNLMTGLSIGDMEVGYKVFKKEAVESFKNDLKSKKFGIEPELVSRIAHYRSIASGLERNMWRISEVPVNYNGRTYQEGKKIKFWDGIKALMAIFYFNLLDR